MVPIWEKVGAKAMEVLDYQEDELNMEELENLEEMINFLTTCYFQTYDSARLGNLGGVP